RPRCSKLRIGLRGSGSESTFSALPKTESISASYLISRIRTSRILASYSGIGARCSGPSPSFEGPASVTPQVSPGPVPEDRAERSQLTVMFCDIVESTALSASMDPEDVREIIAVFQRSVDRDVNRYGGFVAKYMGDGVL